GSFLIELSCLAVLTALVIFFFQAEDGIRDPLVTGVQTCALPIYRLARIGDGEDLKVHPQAFECPYLFHDEGLRQARVAAHDDADRRGCRALEGAGAHPRLLTLEGRGGERPSPPRA